MKTISGKEAYARMRAMRHDESNHFTLHHLTWNERKQVTNGMRVIERARLRPQLPAERYSRPEDMYLNYTDLDMDESRTCYRKLIRFVAFPPDFEILKVNWL